MSADQTIHPFWFIPAHGDGRYLGSPEGARPTEFGFLAQVGQAELVEARQIAGEPLPINASGRHQASAVRR